ncbi:hypothetical protein PCYB_002290, partial [Plasmodium cynomolgi strain B]
KLFTGKGYCNIKRYVFLVEQLENKNILYEFVEYYDLIKDKLTTSENTERDKYCKYMKEINHFIAKCSKNIDDLNYIISKCPRKRLNYIFTHKYKIFCRSQQGQIIVDLSDAAESCNTENNFIPHYSLKENDFIPNDSNLEKAYNELDEDDTNTYYKPY